MSEYIWQNNSMSEQVVGANLTIEPFIDISIFSLNDGKYKVNLGMGKGYLTDGNGVTRLFDSLDEAKDAAELVIDRFLVRTNFKKDIEEK